MCTWLAAQEMLSCWFNMEVGECWSEQEWSSFTSRPLLSRFWFESGIFFQPWRAHIYFWPNLCTMVGERTVMSISLLQSMTAADTYRAKILILIYIKSKKQPRILKTMTLSLVILNSPNRETKTQKCYLNVSIDKTLICPSCHRLLCGIAAASQSCRFS